MTLVLILESIGVSECVVLIILLGLACAGIYLLLRSSRARREALLKPCPFCAEEIRAKAIVCKSCGREIKS